MKTNTKNEELPLTKEEIQQLIASGHQPGRILCGGKSEAAAVACQYVMRGTAAIDKAGMHRQGMHDGWQKAERDMLYIWCENCTAEHLSIVCLPCTEKRFPGLLETIKAHGSPEVMGLHKEEKKREEKLMEIAEGGLPKSTNKNKNLFAVGIGGIDKVLASLSGLTIKKAELLHEGESYDPLTMTRVVKLNFTDGSQLKFETSTGGDSV
jgi:hypothetical protein